jgi:hypothetical protein
MRLTAATTSTDLGRSYRLMLAWVSGDRLALDAVLAEVMADPAGTPGLLFTLVEFATNLGEQVAADFTDQLRAYLLHAEAETEEHP